MYDGGRKILIFFFFLFNRIYITIHIIIVIPKKDAIVLNHSLKTIKNDTLHIYI